MSAREQQSRTASEPQARFSSGTASTSSTQHLCLDIYVSTPILGVYTLMTRQPEYPPHQVAPPPSTRCNCTALREAARYVTQLYDQHLASAGLRSTQFSILA